MKNTLFYISIPVATALGAFGVYTFTASESSSNQLIADVVETGEAAVEANVPAPLNTPFADGISAEAHQALRSAKYTMAMNSLQSFIDDAYDTFSTRGTIIASSPEIMAVVEAFFENELRDPMSAVYTGETVMAYGEDHGALVVCGWVNAKNAFGGYVGRRPYAIAMPHPLSGEASGATGELDEPWVQGACTDAELI